MTFNWLININGDPLLKSYCVELEYQLRPKITKFLISRVDPDRCYDFSCFQFDIDVVAKNVSLSDNTPATLYQMVQADFPKSILDFSRM